MVFKIDFVNGRTVSWSKTENGVKPELHTGYRPRFYIGGSYSELREIRPWLSKQQGVVATSFESWKPTLSKHRQKVLRVDTVSEEKLKATVNKVKKKYGRSTFRYYNVDISPQFRFCLQKNISPVPEESLSRIDLRLHRKHLSNNNITELSINGEKPAGNEEEVLEALIKVFEEENPDIVLVNRGRLLQVLNTKISEHGLEFSLGRMERFQKLAGENTVSSYGKRQHSAARYNIPGRILIDRSNSFMLEEATLEGLWDLVERSYRPLQELAWGSIGRILTSIEVRKAYLEEETLTPWKNWDIEKPKKASTLHKADRGGFIFNPEPSIHYDVYEADYASLFPNIMVKKNISPETVCCSCCDNSRTPELDYSICERRRGFIPKVLKPLVEDRQRMKEKVDEISDEDQKRYMEGSIDAIKWILVSCFGYMGHSHASYGSIKCHQAIQAFDREIMLETKNRFEENGYTVSHGIIDSIWVQKNGCKDFEQLCEEITEEIGIKLEPEHRFEWCAFVPRSSPGPRVATLNRYFGKKQDGEYKTAGIELEQRSTCCFIKNSQMEMIKALDKRMSEDDVLEVVEKRLEELESRKVPTDKLVKKKRCSKKLENYTVRNRTAAALKRAKEHGIDMKPGQNICFVVRDDSADSIDRVRLNFELGVEYDIEFYKKELIRAAESVLSPIGLNREDIYRKISRFNEVSLQTYS